MEKRSTLWPWPLLAGLLGLAFPALGGWGWADDGALPLLLDIGRWMRALSLGSGAGDALAWAIVLILTALPLVALLPTLRHGSWSWADGLLPLLSVLIFALCYFLVNPTLLGPIAGSFFPLACLGAILSALAAWVVFRVLRAMEGAAEERLAAAAQAVLTGFASVMAFGCCWSRVVEFITRRIDLLNGNTDGGTGFTVLILAILSVLSLIPDLLAVLTLLWGAELAGRLGGRVFNRETVDLCQRTAKGCRTVTAATVLIAVGANLLQLLLLRELRSSYFSVVIPLEPLALSMALYLLCRCLQRGKELQDDSDSII